MGKLALGSHPYGGLIPAKNIHNPGIAKSYYTPQSNKEIKPEKEDLLSQGL